MTSTLHYSLLAAHTLFQKSFLRRLNQKYPDLLPGQPKVIDYLMYHPRAFQREIADGCMIEPATLCLILDKLEKVRLIKRGKSENNRKNIQVSLTDRGKKIGISMQEVFSDVESRVCAGLPEEEKERLLLSLRRIRENAEEMLK